MINEIIFEVCTWIHRVDRKKKKVIVETKFGEHVEIIALPVRTDCARQFFPSLKYFPSIPFHTSNMNKYFRALMRELQKHILKNQIYIRCLIPLCARHGIAVSNIFFFSPPPSRYSREILTRPGAGHLRAQTGGNLKRSALSRSRVYSISYRAIKTDENNLSTDTTQSLYTLEND